jgi:hypothetical protein
MPLGYSNNQGGEDFHRKCRQGRSSWRQRPADLGTAGARRVACECSEFAEAQAVEEGLKAKKTDSCGRGTPWRPRMLDPPQQPTQRSEGLEPEDAQSRYNKSLKNEKARHDGRGSFDGAYAPSS